jgi:cyclophilin family peptidyl-prolyl cis-trans isomerase
VETDFSERVLNFDAVKSLWFTAAHGGKGRALVELKATVRSLVPVFSFLFQQFSINSQQGFTVLQFRDFISKSNCGIDDSFIDSNFYEATKFPDDEDDAEEVATITADLPSFTSAVVRIANAFALQETGESDKGLREQLVQWLTTCAAALEIPVELLQTALGDSGLGCHVVDPGFFGPPVDFPEAPCVFLDLAIEKTSEVGESDSKQDVEIMDIGRVVIELNGKVTPKMAYNFMCLCTGERGEGQVSRATLCFRGSSFHRIVPGMCVQGGDIENLDGFGGESVYGGEFEDENFQLLHDTEGVVSMGNVGPNTNTSQFFITLAAAPHLNNENCAFGRVLSGMDVVRKMSEVSTDENDKPVNKCFVKDCGRIE